MTGLGRGNAAAYAPPTHDRLAGRKPALQDLVPADQAAAFLGQIPVHAADEIALELVFAVELFSL